MYVEFLSMTFDVIEAANGIDALAAALQHRPDAIVTDMSLPGMDGFELVERVRRDVTTSRIAVLCLSGYGGDAYEARARQAGCDRVVQKPCLPDALASAILETLAATRDRSAS